MRFQINKAKAITYNTEPTLTDQAAANDTDLNVIVEKFLVHGQMPGMDGNAMHEDFTNLPGDFRGFLELSRSLDAHKATLPPELRDLEMSAILALTPDEILRRLTPVPTNEPTNTGETK